MKRAALLDDDPLELTILAGIADSIAEPWEFTRFKSAEDFLEAGNGGDFSVVFLDRRLPPHQSFEETVTLVEQSGFEGHVVLLTNYRGGTGKPESRLKLLGPYEKIDVQDPDALANLLDGKPLL